MITIDKDLEIRDNETDEEYQYRISSQKEKYGWTWQDVANIINEQTNNCFTESKYRKDWKLILASRRELNDTESKTIVENQDNAKYTFTSEDEEIKERYLTSTERLPYLRLMRQDMRFERFYQLIGNNINKYNPPEFNYVYDYQNPEREFVLSMADFHIGAKFNCVNNNYSIAEAERRFNIALSEVEKFVKEKNINKLHIVSLGDIVQGMLRLTDLKINEADVVDAFVIACRLMANFLNKLSASCYIDFHQVCFSNHDETRPLGTKASELAGEDLGKIFFNYLTDVLALNERIRILGDTTKDYNEFKIFDFECIALHGHQISNLNTVIKDLSARHRKFYDYAFLGHTHSAKEFISSEGQFHNIEILVAPSFIGSDPYADKLMVGSQPAVKIFEFDRKYGHINSYSFILKA